MRGSSRLSATYTKKQAKTTTTTTTTKETNKQICDTSARFKA